MVRAETASRPTRRCYRSFVGMERGAALFDWGVILPPESWVSYIVEPETIHMLYAQQLGLRGRQQAPEWFKEAMPFSVSEPPAHDLPTLPVRSLPGIRHGNCGTAGRTCGTRLQVCSVYSGWFRSSRIRFEARFDSGSHLTGKTND